MSSSKQTLNWLKSEVAAGRADSLPAMVPDWLVLRRALRVKSGHEGLYLYTINPLMEWCAAQGIQDPGRCLSPR